MITVFTPTYNRAHTLPRLYESLCAQTNKNFEWLVINDGSIDNTDELFACWTCVDKGFPIRYIKIENGGKPRAINHALKLARGEYFFIVDSDDMLTCDAIQQYEDGFAELPQNDEHFIGISMIRGDILGNPLHRVPKINPEIGYVDCSNLERSQYDLQADMAEAFFTDKIRKYEFPVWKGEKFTPEAVVWNQMALDGYKLRWYDKIVYLCEYQEDGLTKGSWGLLKTNPMGYAMMFNHQLKVNKKKSNISKPSSIRWKLNNVIQFISCCCLAHEYWYIRNCESKLCYLLFPFGYFLSMRRKRQFEKNV